MAPSWNSETCCNVAGALTEQARQRGDAVAIHYPVGLKSGRINYRQCSYRELDALSDRYARGLAEYGIAQGTRTALMMPPGLEFFALFFAMFKAGVVPVLIDPGIGLKPLKACLDEATPGAFVGISRAQLARCVLRWARGSIRKCVTVGPRLGWGGIGLRELGRLGERSSGSGLASTRPGEMAAILFTSGSTGIPKGVVYRHRHFVSQVGMLQSAFGIEAGEVDLPTFAPFALFDPALGMTTVLPWMDPTRPSQANPELLIQSIERFGVTNVFGSPAVLRVLGGHARRAGIRLPGVRRVISAGAAVPIPVMRDMQSVLDDDARVYTPYGATECLPVSAIHGGEIDPQVEALTLAGEGICVGRPVPPNDIAIVAVRDDPIDYLEPGYRLPPGVVGEIAVHGPTTTDAYWQRDQATRLAKICDERGRTWHRMGDAGYLDGEGRLWYCGRKSQRIELDGVTLYPDQVEAHFNQHPEVLRTALVGADTGDGLHAVLCVELETAADAAQRHRIETDLLQMARSHPRFHAVSKVLFHPGFPVDIRHNSKIGREQLSRWAARKLETRG